MKVCAKCGEEIYTKDGENVCDACEEDIQTSNKKSKKLSRKAKHQLLTDLGLVRVRGALGGVYYE